jgi:hypothetical protein
MGVPRSVTRALAGVLAAPVVLVAACGGGDTSIADPPISPHPTTSSPTQQPHRESPEHFIRRWAAADIKMQNSGESASFRSMSNDCADCDALANRVDAIYRAGGFIRTKGWSIKKVEVVSRRGAHFLVNLHVVSTPTKYREASDAPMKRYPGGPAIYQLNLAKADGGWAVTSLGRIAA